ncbi:MULTISPECIES: DUF305 domain-containing protein [Streptomyces]|uniref:DUF305 domain-containing protein n=1 Tax=Streptomyces TaxID=1883 RepID=UPI00034E18EF|nr:MULTISPECIES: DUF305 domain-containing protein [Streptomyces]EPD91633.1 hypothetical protein HMPREF1486_04592 [Streptomyces sp. HPH0547]UVN53399.1 DUF305 domain-containing protein [Streptomyces albus]
MRDRHRARTRRSPAAVAALALAAALTALPALAGCTGGTSAARSGEAKDGPPVVAPGKPGEAARTLSPRKAREKAGKDTEPNAADVEYATMMIEHHQQALVMTRLAPDRAAGSAVRKLASRIGAGQGPEIKAMRGWLAQHRRQDGGNGSTRSHEGHGSGHGAHAHGGQGTGHGSGHSTGGQHDGHGTMPGMATEAQLAQLRKAEGKAFDQLFLTLMTTHHKGAVTMAVQVLEKGNDVRIEEMATDVMAQQRAEIARMRKLR